MQALLLNIFGEPCSKANSRRIVKFGNKIASIKSEKALNYASSFKQQCAVPESLKLTCDVVVTVRIWYASRRPDLDESLILDLLQGVAYDNDRQVKEKHIYWMGVDKEIPRCEIEVSEHKKSLLV
jgi:Holliday junction resolvase RusA-like endonuclease